MNQQTHLTKHVEALRTAIQVAFPDRPFLGSITAVDGLTNEELDEQRALYSALRGRKWSEIPLPVIESNPDGIVLLTDEAFIAFLPAWLTHALAHEKIRELLIYVFSPAVHASMKKMDQRIRLLNSMQMEALRGFLEFSFSTENSTYIKEQAAHALTYVERVRNT